MKGVRVEILPLNEDTWILCGSIDSAHTDYTYPIPCPIGKSTNLIKISDDITAGDKGNIIMDLAEVEIYGFRIGKN